MIGFIIGLVLGSFNFFLLTKLTAALFRGDTVKMVLFFVAKIATLATSLLVTAFLFKDQLIFNGIGLVIPLIIGGFFYQPIQRFLKKNPKSE